MIGPRDAQYLLVFVFDGTPYEKPVQSAHDDVRSDAAVAKCAAKAGLLQVGNQARVKAEGVEVAGDDYGSLGWIALGVMSVPFAMCSAMVRRHGRQFEALN